MKSALLLSSALAVFAAGGASAQQLAFPGAEGYGRFAIGGRGGAVIQVTNLLDSGAGSLRACVDASGPRTCVFRVAGTIELDSSMIAVNDFITIAGQTAPGQGIQLKNRNSLNAPLQVRAKHVIVRHVRFRAGPSVSPSDNVDNARVSGVGSIAETENITDIIFDHDSFMFSTDETIDISPWGDRITIQASILAEGLNNSTHTSGPHSKGPNLRGCGVSIVDSLISTNVIRNPNNTCGAEDPNSPRGGGGVTGETEFRNNVVYNGQRGFFDYFNGRGPSAANVVGNVFIRGPATHSNALAPYAVDARDFLSKYADDGLMPGDPFYLPAGTSDPQKLCLQDNLSIGFPGDAGAPTSRAPEIHGVLDPRDANLVQSTDCVTNPVGEAAWAGGIRGLTGPVTPSGQVEADVAANVGAFWWNRDAADARVLNNLANRTGNIIDDPSQVGGWPVLAGGTPYPDADADGMSDAFEAANSLNPNDPADRNGDIDADGYTNLEEFLSELAGDAGSPPPPALPVVSVSVAPASQNEGTGADTALYTFTFTRAGDLSGASTVDFDEEGVGASPASPTDFTNSAYLHGQVSFAAGEATKQRFKTAKADVTPEADETFQTRISNPSGASIGTATALATIVNDDSSWTIVALQASVLEGNSGPTATSYTITRTGDVSAAATIEFTVAGEAYNGNPAATCSDFPSGVCPSGVVSFTAGQASKGLGVNVKGDTTVESNEAFAVFLANPSSGVLGQPAKADVIITNDDGAGGGGSAALGVGEPVETKGNAAVHSPLGGPRVGVQAVGADGVITQGPGKASGETWWRVNFVAGPDGWVRQTSLAPA